jgi:acyl-coenzyme A thioesterase PaaI-like protein
MDVTEIPFVEKVGITRSTKGLLELPFNETIQNHLQTIHASAQFALAETASGEILQTIFPELVGKVAPAIQKERTLIDIRKRRNQGFRKRCYLRWYVQVVCTKR